MTDTTMNPNDHIGNEYDAMTGDQQERHEAANSRCSASAGSVWIHPRYGKCTVTQVDGDLIGYRDEGGGCGYVTEEEFLRQNSKD